MTVHATRQRNFVTIKIISHVGLVLKKTRAGTIHDYLELTAFKMLSVDKKWKTSAFKFLRFEGCFRKAPFSWRISVDGRSNRRGIGRDLREVWYQILGQLWSRKSNITFCKSLTGQAAQHSQNFNTLVPEVFLDFFSAWDERAVKRRTQVAEKKSRKTSGTRVKF